MAPPWPPGGPLPQRAAVPFAALRGAPGLGRVPGGAAGGALGGRAAGPEGDAKEGRSRGGGGLDPGAGAPDQGDFVGFKPLE